MRQSTGSPRVRHDFVTERQQWRGGRGYPRQRNKEARQQRAYQEEWLQESKLRMAQNKLGRLAKLSHAGSFSQSRTFGFSPKVRVKLLNVFLKQEKDII